VVVLYKDAELACRDIEMASKIPVSFSSKKAENKTGCLMIIAISGTRIMF
jgi:hypothetical protein